MKITLDWMEDYIQINDNLKLNWDDIFVKLTSSGIEIEDIFVGNIKQDQNIKMIDILNAPKTSIVIDFKITPNRGDCLSVNGILREIQTLTNYRSTYHEYMSQIKTTWDNNINNKDIQNKTTPILPPLINIQEPHYCPNYTAIAIHNTNNTKSLPDFIPTRLINSNIKSISPLVDIANYVMLETGQPLHIFDANKVGHTLTIRNANPHETIELLDGTIANLLTDTLIIADKQNTPTAIAGVMGGLDSGVTIDTKNIIIESAHFIPEIIIGKAKYYSVSSDAAYRFERGVDIASTKDALMVASTLILKYLNGNPSEIVEFQNTDHSSTPHRQNQIIITIDKIKSMIGIDIDINIVTAILSKLNCRVEIKLNTLHITPPSYRFDIQIPQDIIEEIARVYGYDNIPPIMPTSQYTINTINPSHTINTNYKNILVSRGYNENISYSFLEEKYANLFNYTNVTPIALKNSIASFTHMRTTLLAGLFKAMEYNVNRKLHSIRLFELSRVFYGDDANSQPVKLSGLCYGKKSNYHWINGNATFNFYDIKGDVEAIFQGLPLKFTTYEDNPLFHSGRCAKIYLANKEVGVVGQIHPKIVQDFRLDYSPYVFEVDIDSINQSKTTFKLLPISKYQKVERDLAFVMNNTLPTQNITDFIDSLSIDIIRDVIITDIYTGDKIPSTHKSVTFKFIFQGNKTLDIEDTNSTLHTITNKVIEKFNIQLR